MKIPLLGEVNKKTATIGIIAIAGAGGIWYWRRQKASQTAQATTGADTTGMVTDPAGNQCAALADSGYCPGTPEDSAYQEQQSGAGYDLGVGSYGGGIGGYYGNTGQLCPDGSVPQGYDEYGNPVCNQGTTTPTAITTNSQWIQEVDTLFPTYTTAVAMVLGGVTVTTAQKNQFLEAVGVFGPPPQGYPTPIQTSDTSGQPGSPASGGKVTVPLVVGSRAETAKQLLHAVGLKPVAPATKPGVAYYVTSSSPSHGAKVSAGSSVKLSLSTKKP